MPENSFEGSEYFGVSSALRLFSSEPLTLKH
jgi:hypothetical protein